jgi:hypothetical protein
LVGAPINDLSNFPFFFFPELRSVEEVLTVVTAVVGPDMLELEGYLFTAAIGGLDGGTFAGRFGVRIFSIGVTYNRQYSLYRLSW